MWKPVTIYGLSRSWLLHAYTSPTDVAHNFTYNVYWGPELAHDYEMVLGYEGIVSTNFTHNNMNGDTRYNVTAIWDNRETEFSNPVFLGPTVGIASELAESQTAAYPNPVKDVLNIEGLGLRHVTLYTVTGLKIYEQDLHADSFSLNMKSFPTGLYLLNILSNEGVSTCKVMKQ